MRDHLIITNKEKYFTGAYFYTTNIFSVVSTAIKKLSIEKGDHIIFR